MGLYIVKRLVLAIPILILASVLIFFLIHLAPGGPVRVMLGPMQDDVLVEKIRQQLGLDLPLHEQYLRWAGNAIQGDLGFSVSIQRGAPVAELISKRFLVTIELTLISMIIATIIAIPTGMISALRQNRLADHFSRIVALVGISIPNIFLGILLILVFGVWLLLPWGSGGFVPLSRSLFGNISHMILPSIALGTAYAAVIMRMMRSTMLDVMGQDYIRTARALGIPNRQIIRRDIVRNALIPVVTVMGNSIGYLLGGAIVTETIFRLPGMGNLVITGVFRRDFPVIQGIVLTIVIIRIIVNLSVDVTYSILDPRIRYGGKK